MEITCEIGSTSLFSAKTGLVPIKQFVPAHSPPLNSRA
jgi:hypothetical protein